MATYSILVDDTVQQEAVEIASQLGLSLNTAINVFLRKFIEAKGFPFDVRLSPEAHSAVFEMGSEEFTALCRDAVQSREPVATFGYTTGIDDAGNVYKRCSDGRVEYVLL